MHHKFSQPLETAIPSNSKNSTLNSNPALYNAEDDLGLLKYMGNLFLTHFCRTKERRDQFAPNLQAMILEASSTIKNQPMANKPLTPLSTSSAPRLNPYSGQIPHLTPVLASPLLFPRNTTSNNIPIIPTPTKANLMQIPPKQSLPIAPAPTLPFLQNPGNNYPPVTPIPTPSDSSIGKNLTAAICDAFNQYEHASKGGVKNRHGKTGMRRLEEDKAKFNTLTSSDHLLNFISSILRRKEGNYNPSSFKTVLLKSLAQKFSVQFPTPSSHKDTETITIIENGLKNAVSQRQQLVPPSSYRQA